MWACVLGFLPDCGWILAHSSWQIIFISPRLRGSLWFTHNFKILFLFETSIFSLDLVSWPMILNSPLICQFMFLSMTYNAPVPLTEQPQFMMLPPPCFTFGMVFLGSYTPFLSPNMTSCIIGNVCYFCFIWPVYFSKGVLLCLNLFRHASLCFNLVTAMFKAFAVAL